MKNRIDTVNKCKQILERLKAERYVHFHNHRDDGFIICYINEFGEIEFQTYDEEVEKYFLKHGMWRLNEL